MIPFRALVPLCSMLGVVGCARPEPATAQQLRARAGFELGCPAEELELVQLDRSTGGVIGCGRRVVYVESCSSGPSCTWSFDREAPAIGWGAWPQPARRSPGMNGYPGEEPPRASPYAPAARAAEEYEPDPEWRNSVPRKFREDPGF
jgi:hypothetical protein